MEQLTSLLSALLGGGTTILLAIAAVVIGLILFMAIGRVMGFLQKVAPNQALIVYGAGIRSTVEVLRKERNDQTGVAEIKRKQVKVSFKIVKGGSVLVWPFLQAIKTLDLSLVTLEDVKVAEVRTNDYVPVSVDAVAQIKIGSDDAFIATAAEQHLDKKPAEIWGGASQTLQGHLRAIIGSMKAADITTNREKFSQAVLEVAVDDLSAMGIQIISLVPKEIHDKQDYYESLGKPEIARASMEARVASATADQTASKREQEAAANKAEYVRDTEVKKATFDKDVKTQQAIAGKAAEIASAEQQKTVEQNKATAAEFAAKRREQELQSEVLRPADAKKYEIQTLAEAELVRAQRNAEATRVTGEAEAAANQAKGLAAAEIEKQTLLARAEGERELAKALSSYGPEALRLVLGQALVKVMPSIAGSFGEAFANIEQIRLIEIGGGAGGAGEGTAGAVQKFLDMLPNTLYKFLTSMAALIGGPVDDLAAGLLIEEARKRGIPVSDDTKNALKKGLVQKLGQEAQEETPPSEPQASPDVSPAVTAPAPANPAPAADASMAAKVKTVIDDATKLVADTHALKRNKRA